MAAVDLVEYAAAHRVQQDVEASVTVAYVANVPLPLCQWWVQDGLREVEEALEDLVLEDYTPDRLGMADLAQQKQSDYECLEDDGQVTQTDEEVPQKLTVRAEDPGGAASCAAGSIVRREYWNPRRLEPIEGRARRKQNARSFHFHALDGQPGIQNLYVQLVIVLDSEHASKGGCGLGSFVTYVFDVLDLALELLVLCLVLYIVGACARCYANGIVRLVL